MMAGGAVLRCDSRAFVRRWAMTVLRLLLAATFCLVLFTGCGGTISDELSSEDIAKQRAEDKQRTDEEDQKEREYQRKLRQQGS